MKGYWGEASVPQIVQMPSTGRWVWCGSLAVWPGRRLVRLGDTLIVLTPGELAVLMALVEAQGEPVSRTMLAAAAGRRGEPRIGSRTVDMHICTLRKKLGDDRGHPSIIATVRAAGYAIQM
jgi:DNA-binding response OmpR family regulator